MAEWSTTMSEAIPLPFWSKKEGFVARECVRCGHRGWFEILEDPVMISDEVMCPACGSITFRALSTNPTLDESSIEQVIEAAAEEASVDQAD